GRSSSRWPWRPSRPGRPRLRRPTAPARFSGSTSGSPPGRAQTPRAGATPPRPAGAPPPGRPPPEDGGHQPPPPRGSRGGGPGGVAAGAQAGGPSSRRARASECSRVRVLSARDMNTTGQAAPHSTPPNRQTAVYMIALTVRLALVRSGKSITSAAPATGPPTPLRSPASPAKARSNDGGP